MAIAVTMIAPRPVWIVFGFEAMAVVAGVFAILFARGKFQDGQGLTLASIAGTLVVGAALSQLGTPRGVTFTAHGAPISLLPWTLWRLAAGAIFALLGAFAVLRRNPASWLTLAWAVAVGIPVLVGAGAWYKFRVRIGESMAGWPDALQAALYAVVALVVLVMVSASGHLLIRAFEMGRDDEPQPAKPAPSR